MALRFGWERAATDTLRVYQQARADSTGTASA
jgi:starch synthase